MTLRCIKYGRTDLKNASGISLDNRRKFALKAFRHTACYDAAISNWFTKQIEGPNALPRYELPMNCLFELVN